MRLKHENDRIEFYEVGTEKDDSGMPVVDEMLILKTLIEDMQELENRIEKLEDKINGFRQ